MKKFAINIVIVTLILTLYGCENSKKNEDEKKKSSQVLNDIRNSESSIENSNNNSFIIDGRGFITKKQLQDKTSEFIIPNSDKELITEEILDKLKKEEINFARNEIYARHGYIFTIEKYSDYFKSKSWYKENPNFSISLFNKIENINIEFINKYVDSGDNSTLEVVNNYGEYDLNGDAVKDQVELQRDGIKYILKVNDKTLTITKALLEINSSLYIYNVDKEDSYLEIAVIDEDDSEDSEEYSADFYYYNGNEIIYMGTIPGNYDSIGTSGNGKITTEKKSKILDMCYYKKSYQLSQDRFVEEVKENAYPINLNVKMKMKLDLYQFIGSTDIFYTVYEGEDVKLEFTDDKKWCSIVNKEGKEGWFEVENVNTINGYNATELFEGLE